MASFPPAVPPRRRGAFRESPHGRVHAAASSGARHDSAGHGSGRSSSEGGHRCGEGGAGGRPHDRFDVRGELDEAGHHPRKALGQHYLTSRAHLDLIADTIAAAAAAPATASLSASATAALHSPSPPPAASPLPAGVLEIGAGPGNLTAALLARGLPVWAVELDRAAVPIHQKNFAHDLAAGRLTIEYGDALRTDPRRVLAWTAAHGAAPGALVVAGNIPYNITSPLIFRALEWLMEEVDVRAVVFLMQRDVAERAVAGPGSRTYGVLSAKLAMLARARIVARVPAGAFWPPPKVESAVLEITPRPRGERPPREELAAAWRVMERAFQQRRKMLVSTLARKEAARRARVEAWLTSIGLTEKARPEEIGPPHWLALARLLAEG